MVSVLMALLGCSFVRHAAMAYLERKVRVRSPCDIAFKPNKLVITRLEALGEDEMVRLCAFALVLMTVEGACAQGWPSRPNTYVRNEIAANETLVKAAGLAAK
jgi:hypothetical protein